jgi:hypothetical protein
LVIPLAVVWSLVSVLKAKLVVVLFPLPFTGVIWLIYAYIIKRFFAPKHREAEAAVSSVQRKIQAVKIKDPNLTNTTRLYVELDITKKEEMKAKQDDMLTAGFCVIHISMVIIFFILPLDQRYNAASLE